MDPNGHQQNGENDGGDEQEYGGDDEKYGDPCLGGYAPVLYSSTASVR